MNYAQLVERELEHQEELHWQQISRLCMDGETRKLGRQLAMERIKAIGQMRKYRLDGERYAFEPEVMGGQCELLTDETSAVRHVAYIIVDADGFVAYIGQTTQPISKRLRGHEHRDLIRNVYFMQASSRQGELNRLEYSLIRVLQPYANKVMAEMAVIDPVRTLDKYGIAYKNSPHLCRRLGLDCRS